jgi:hypothetical protein
MFTRDRRSRPLRARSAACTFIRPSIAHELGRARRAFPAAPPFTTVTVQRETMVKLITPVQGVPTANQTRQPDRL